MTVLYTFDIDGLTTSAVKIAGLTDVTITSDGFFNFTDANSRVWSIKIEGAFAQLIKALYIGTNGMDAGSSGVQGHRVFGMPVLTQ